MEKGARCMNVAGDCAKAAFSMSWMRVEAAADEAVAEEGRFPRRGGGLAAAAAATTGAADGLGDGDATEAVVCV